MYASRGGDQYKGGRGLIVTKNTHFVYAGLLKMLQYLKRLNHDDWHNLERAVPYLPLLRYLKEN